MDELPFRIMLIGLGANTMLIGLFQASENPYVAYPVVVAGAVLILYAVSSFAFTGFRRFALYLPVSLKKSVVTERDLTLAAKLRWRDSVGKPQVHAVESTYKVYSIWAALYIEARNSSYRPQRISRLYMEIRSSRFPKRLIAIANASHVANGPALEDGKIEWLLPEVSEAITEYVYFERFWQEGDDTMPQGPKQFEAIIVAELGRPDRTVRLQIGDDVWDTTFEVTRLPEHTDEDAQETPEPSPEAP